MGFGRRRRSDAERNRAALLAAARSLLRDRNLASVTMDEVAAAAGVGKGTLFRAFGDKGGLAIALLDDRERTLQERVLTGPPPVGPGASPAARLDAFVGSYLELLEDAADLLVIADNNPVGARYRTGAYTFWHTHVGSLLRAVDSACDDDPVAHCVLAVLAADLHLHVRGEEQIAKRRWAAAVRQWTVSGFTPRA